jgi:16S rRNA (guanine527-N7)-methyltransferase
LSIIIFSILKISPAPNGYNFISMKELIENAWSLLRLQITPSQQSALEIYERELIEWNTRYNLTAIDDPQKIQVKHFLDSLTCLLTMRNTPTDRVIDIGTGAGFPGIPLKIVCPTISLTLIESVGKKASFCRHIVETLELNGVEILQERAETIGTLSEYRQKYDWAIARAVAVLPVLVEYLLPFVRMGGYALAMKGENGPAEAHSAERSLHLLGGQLHQLIPVTLPGVEDQRYLVVIAKTAATPDRYPRRVGIPAKRPL